MPQLSEATDQATLPRKTYDVAIVGVGIGANYGSVMTYYSLYKTIEDFGNNVLMVSKIGASADDPEIQDTHSMRFARAHYNLSEVYSRENAGELNKLAGTFVVGSDQVWNYGISKGFGKAFYLDFAADHKRKISYAASFGHAQDFAPVEAIPEISALLRRFNAISVRESSGIDIAKRTYGVPATQVAEPIFLTDVEHYSELAARSARDTSEPYLLAYILDPTPEKKAAIEHIAGKLGLKVRIILDAWSHLFEENKAKMDMPGAVEENVDTYDFLRLYENSSYVLTDSFHGTAFALKFEKPFASIGNRRRGVTRFDSMFERIGHRERFTLNPEEIIARDSDFMAPLDFTEIRDILNRHVRYSRTWLERSLKTRVNDTVARREKRANYKQRARTKLRLLRARARRFLARVRARLARTPSFATNTEAWLITADRGTARLRVADPSYSRQPGNFVWTDLPIPLSKGSAYALTVEWSIHTTSRAISIHLRNPETGGFTVVGTVSVGEARDVPRTDTVDFVVPETGFTQLMLGARQFGGAEGGADITRVTVRSIQPHAIRDNTSDSLKSSVVATDESRRPDGNRPVRSAREGSGAQNPSGLADIHAPDPKNRKELATPDHTPNREERIVNVLSNPRVHEWKRILTERLPDLRFYVGRELKEYTNNKVGGPADVLAFPKTIDEIKGIVAVANEFGIDITVLGRGSNVLVRDGGIRGIVVLTTDLRFFRLDDGTFTAGAGASLIEAAFYLLDNERSGLEWAAGIPGTIGGAVYMNAGTYTSDIRSNITAVTVIDRAGAVFPLRKDEIDWGVRYTTFQDRKDWIILDATFRTASGSNLEMARKMIGTVQARENSMPMESPNHGSTFKWYRAPRLIAQAGLVGTRIGGAKISEKQPGFIINVKQATSSDYEALIDYVIARVYAFSGFMLEPEVEIIGQLPHQYKRYPKGDGTGPLE